MPLASSNLLLKKLLSESPSIEKNPIQNPTMRGSPKNPLSKVPVAMLPIIPRIVLWRPSNGFPSKNVRFQSIGQFHLSFNKNAITGGAALTAQRRIMNLKLMSIIMESPYLNFVPKGFSHLIITNSMRLYSKKRTNYTIFPLIYNGSVKTTFSTMETDKLSMNPAFVPKYSTSE